MFFLTFLRSRYPQLLLFFFLISAFLGLGCKRNDTPGAPSSRPAGYVERMAQEHKNDAPSASPLSAQKPRQEVIAESIVFGKQGEQALRGVLARPKAATEPLPAIILIHEWWGLNSNIQGMARILAGEGYLVLAVDFYAGKVTDQPDEAMRLMKAALAKTNEGKDLLQQAFFYLQKEKKSPKIGSLGWCFGGAWSLQAGLLLPKELHAVALYYGRLVLEREKLATLQMPILGIFGELDRGIPVEKVKEFQATLQALKKDATILIYPGADHAFANPSGKRYQAKAAEEAWKQTLAFFKTHLRS